MASSLVPDWSRKGVGANEGSTAPFIDVEGSQIGEEIGRSECVAGNSAAGVSGRHGGVHL
jgi:hypothetical protein